MKKLILRFVTILLAFAAGVGFMSYATYMGNRDMTTVMGEATLPVLYAEEDGMRYNEMHGYVEPMDGSYMKELLLGLPEDHHAEFAIEKYNAQIKNAAYEVRSLDGSRLIEDKDHLELRDDGKYLHFELDLKDLLDRGEKYLLILKLQTSEHPEIFYYSQISYLGENHVRECVEFAKLFHEAAFHKDTNQEPLKRLEPDGTIDGRNFGYVNIHAYPRTVVWGDMPVKQVTEEKLHFTDIRGNVASLVLEYQVQNTDTKELYEVSEAFCIQYTQSRMYLQNYERTADRIFEADGQLVEDKKINFGIQSREFPYIKNEEENVIGFVQRGQLWCYDFGQNRLSLVYGFEDKEDARGLYGAHDFRILKIEDSGSMDFLVYGYMNRGLYEGRCGILLCRYDALMNTVEERYFLPSDRPYEIVKEELGKLSVVNEKNTAWLSYRNMILRIDLNRHSIQVLAEGISEEQIQVSKSNDLAAWTDEKGESISLLDTRTGVVREIDSEPDEMLRVLGFMEEDFLYGTAKLSHLQMDPAGRRIVPLYRVIIRDHSGNEVREFDYASKGKYVTSVEIIENRIDLSCITLGEDGSYEPALPEPITYTSEPAQEKLRLVVAGDEVKRNEYQLLYEGTMKNGSMKHPRVRMVLYEENRVLELTPSGEEYYFAWSFGGHAESFETLAQAVGHAHEQMGTVWRKGYELLWERWNRASRTQIEGFEADPSEMEGSSLAQCLRLLLRQRQIYTDVQAELDQGTAVWEICERELGENCILLPGCSLRMALYYVNLQAPVMAVTDTGGAVLIVGYDAQNIVYYEAGKTGLQKAGMNDSSEMFERGGNLFFTYRP